MSEQESLKSDGGKQVSKARKIVSGVVLLGLLVVLGIEGRAGFGHSSAAKALQEIAPDGAFAQGTVTEEQIDDMMSLSPTKEELVKTDAIIEYKYSWKSVIRPMMENMAPTDLYVSFTNTEPRHAIFYGTDAPVPVEDSPDYKPSKPSQMQPPSLDPPPPLQGAGNEATDTTDDDSSKTDADKGAADQSASGDDTDADAEVDNDESSESDS